MIYFTSDPHYEHTNVIVHCNRQFESVYQMNEQLVLNWNNLVTPEDTTYIIGDFSLSFRAVEQYAHRLNGTKILISGNHDFTHAANKKSRQPENQAKWVDLYIKHGFTSVKTEDFIELGGIKFRMHHMPYLNVNDDRQNHQKHRAVDDGIPLIHGHTHQKDEWSYGIKDTLQVHVGVDAHNYTPISELKVLEIYNKYNLKD
jgi:calcineurin-like phosphoesterase family protein